MAFSNGVFSRLYNWVNDKAASINITASRFDAEDDGFATGLSTCMLKDGTQILTANIPFAGFKITGYGTSSAPSARSDVPSLGQVEDGVINWVVAGGTADVITAGYSPAITALVDGQLCFFRASAANATTTPTFSPNGLTARTITKKGGIALAIGDIQRALVEVILRYNLANTRWEMVNAPSGQMLSGQSVNSLSAATTGFVGIANITAAEITAQIPVPLACTIRNLYIRAGAAPVGVETFTYTVRKNGADTAVTCQITGAATTGSDLTHSVSFAAGDLLAVKAVTSGGATSTTHNWGLEIDPT